MPIRVACPDCSATLTAPDTAAGTVVDCPKCRTPLELPDTPTRRPARDEDDDEPDDRPRRRAKGRRKAKGGIPGWAVAVLVGLGVVVVGGGVYLATRGKPGDAAGGSGPAAVGAAAAGVRYVPHESERKLNAAIEARGNLGGMTEAEVFAIMGEPTRRGEVVTVTRDGRTFTVYDAYWDVPGSGAGTRVSFMNGAATGVQTAGGGPARDDD